MDIRLEEDNKRLIIRISSNKIADRRFLRQLTEHGASVTLDDFNIYWTSINITSRLPEEAELEAIDKMLEAP